MPVAIQNFPSGRSGWVELKTIFEEEDIQAEVEN